jgi:ribokinase
MRPPRLVVVGSINVDMVVKGSRLPAPGETVIGGRFVTAPGGKGANQAVAAARLGAHVTLVAKVGRDSFGDQAVENCQGEGIVTHAILRDPENPTGVALILVDERGENLISVASGANHALRPEDVSQAAASIRDADLVLLQLEIPPETVRFTARLAAEAGVPVLLDPAPAPSTPLDRELIRDVTYLKPNATEAGRLTGIAVEDEATARQAAEELLRAGARHAIVTLGAKGALWDGPGGAWFLPGHRVEAIDSTAAGDAFSGGLACALARRQPLDQAVGYASLVAALSTTRMGAQPSLPTRDEVSRFEARQGDLRGIAVPRPLS